MIDTGDYVKVGRDWEHRKVAKKALGKPLPKGAEIHHINGIRSDNRPENLVICQDREYHCLLHVRINAFEACGNPHWRKCRYCHEHSAPEDLKQEKSANQWFHPTCKAQTVRESYRRCRHKRKDKENARNRELYAIKAADPEWRAKRNARQNANNAKRKAK